MLYRSFMRTVHESAAVSTLMTPSWDWAHLQALVERRELMRSLDETCLRLSSPKLCLNNIRSESVAWEGIFYGSGAYRLCRGLSIEAALSHIGSYSKPNKLIGSPSWNPFWGLSWFLWINIDKFFFASPQDNPYRSRELKIVAPFQIYKVVKKTRVCRKCQGGTQYLD